MSKTIKFQKPKEEKTGSTKNKKRILITYEINTKLIDPRFAHKLKKV